jgi:hypothetical protein
MIASQLTVAWPRWQAILARVLCAESMGTGVLRHGDMRRARPSRCAPFGEAAGSGLVVMHHWTGWSF